MKGVLMKSTDGSKTMEQQGRHYVRVSDEQRSLLINLMSQNEHVTIRDASNLLQINYESAKSIWTVFKRFGRKHNLKNHKNQLLQPSPTLGGIRVPLTNSAPLPEFDQECQLLKREADECVGYANVHFL